MTERRFNHFTGKEKRFILTKAERLLQYAKNITDGTGDPEANAIDFEIELNDIKRTYDNFKKYKGGEP